jgi:hypothetical protein
MHRSARCDAATDEWLGAAGERGLMSLTLESDVFVAVEG